MFTLWTTQVEWINRILDVPLYDNIQDYKTLPEAELYIDGIKTNDPFVYYERDGVDHTFFSVISTSHVRTYTMRYRVYFPSYNVIHTEDIVFNIVDLIPPVIEQIEAFRIPLGNSMPDLKIGFIYLDNYDAIENLNISINDMEVILNETGIYPIYYQVSDLSGNVTNATSILEVYDFIPPTISLLETIVLSYDDPFIWQDFIRVSDNDDPYPYVLVDDSLVAYEIIGNYTIKVYATDKNGLSSNRTFNLSIVDDEPPIIYVKSQPTPISVFSNESDIDFFSYVIQVEDNYDDLQIYDLVYRHDIEFDVLGQYYIYYSLSDDSGNSVELKMKINVVDNVKPEINILYPLIFDVDETEPFFIDFIEYSDNYTSYDQLILKLIESVKMDIVGKYPFTIEVTDDSDNKTTLRTYIEIVDRIEPQIIQLNDIIITDFTYKDLTYYFDAADNYDTKSDLVILVDDTLVDYEHIGLYQIIVYATDLSDNTETFETEIIVIDIEEPQLILRQNFIIVEVFSAPIDFSSYIIEVQDNYDSLNYEDVTYIGQVNYGEVGIYPIACILTDSSQNTTTKTLYVKVDDLTPPTIESISITLKVGDYFDPYEGLEVSDNLEIINLEWFPQYLDTSNPGTKTMNYVAMDARGNYTTHQRIIIVEPVSELTPFVAYIPLGMITILGVVACIYFYKRMN